MDDIDNVVDVESLLGVALRPPILRYGYHAKWLELRITPGADGPRFPKPIPLVGNRTDTFGCQKLKPDRESRR